MPTFTEPALLAAVAEGEEPLELELPEEIAEPEGEEAPLEAEAPLDAVADAPVDSVAEADPDAAPLEAAAEELPAAAPFLAACWKASNDFSAVGFTAKTIPFWQWFLGLKVQTQSIRLLCYNATLRKDVRLLVAEEPEGSGSIGNVHRELLSAG